MRGDRNTGGGASKARLHELLPALQQRQQLRDERVEVGRHQLRLGALGKVDDRRRGVGLDPGGGGEFKGVEEMAGRQRCRLTMGPGPAAADAAGRRPGWHRPLPRDPSQFA